MKIRIAVLLWLATRTVKADDILIFGPSFGTEVTSTKTSFGESRHFELPVGGAILANVGQFTIEGGATRSIGTGIGIDTNNALVGMKWNFLPYINVGGGFIRLYLVDLARNDTVRAPYGSIGIRFATESRQIALTSTAMWAPRLTRSGTGLDDSRGVGWGIETLALFQFSKHLGFAMSYGHLHVESDLEPSGLPIKIPETINREAFRFGTVLRF